MAYVLRFVQRFRPRPKGALARLAGDPDHERLLKRLLPFFLDAWTEIHEVLDF